MKSQILSMALLGSILSFPHVARGHAGQFVIGNAGVASRDSVATRVTTFTGAGCTSQLGLTTLGGNRTFHASTTVSVNSTSLWDIITNEMLDNPTTVQSVTFGPLDNVSGLIFNDSEASCIAVTCAGGSCVSSTVANVELLASKKSIDSPRTTLSPLSDSQHLDLFD